MYKYYLAVWGRIVGIAFMILPAGVDIILYGARGYEDMSIKWKGILLMVIGFTIERMGAKYNKEL